MRIEKRDVFELIDTKYETETNAVIEYIKKKEMPYRDLSRDKVIRAALVWILKYKGYTYISDRLYNLFNKVEIDYKAVYETLINGNILKRRPTKYVSNIVNEKITFKESFGINKSFYIRLNRDDYPFKIRYISNTYKGFVECKFENKDIENKIDIKITIPEDVGYPIDIEECLVVYTDYKILFFKFNILKLEDVEKESFSDLKILNTLKMMKERTRRIVSVDKGLKKIEGKNQWEYTKEYLQTIKNKDVAIEIFNLYKYKRLNLEKAIPIKYYIEILEDIIEIEEVNVKIGYLLEEFLITTSFMARKMVDYLEKLYLEGYRSDLTEEVLEVLKFSNLKLETKKKLYIVDLETINDFSRGNVSLEMASKILNTKGVRYDKGLVEMMKDFYKETDDIKAIEKVILKGKRYKIEVSEGDIISLINRRKEGIQIKESVIIKSGRKYINKNNYIKNEIELIGIKRKN